MIDQHVISSTSDERILGSQHMLAKRTHNQKDHIQPPPSKKRKCPPCSAAQETTDCAQNSIQQTPAKSSRTCNSFTSPSPSGAPTHTLPTPRETSGAATLAKGNQAGSAESTAPIRPCGTILSLVTRIGLRILSRLLTGSLFRSLYGRSDL
jgi:hypothetical protein